MVRVAKNVDREAYLEGWEEAKRLSSKNIPVSEISENEVQLPQGIPKGEVDSYRKNYKMGFNNFLKTLNKA